MVPATTSGQDASVSIFGGWHRFLFLAAVVEAWPSLPPAVLAGILAIVQASR